MSYEPIALRGFRGLNLVADPESVNEYNRRYRTLIPGAIDLLNVAFTTDGQVRQRDGYANFTSALGSVFTACAGHYTALTGAPTLVGHLSAGGATDLKAFNASGTEIASTTGAGGIFTPSMVARGIGEIPYIYVTRGNSSVMKWDGTAFAAIAGADVGEFLTVQYPGNRLVLGFTVEGGNIYYSRVRFSDIDSDTFGANNYVDLGTGDGLRLTGLCSWRELVFAFKDDKFFVFYGNSTQSDGSPQFNFRTIDTGVGAVGGHAGASIWNEQGVNAVAGRDGVYFVNRRGVYITTGNTPALISRPVDPIFTGSASPFFASSTLNQTKAHKMTLAWHGERLYLAYPSGSSTTNDRLLVFDPALNVWSLFDIKVSCMTPWSTSATARKELFFGVASGSNRIARHSSSYTDDAGSNITSRYRWGFFSPSYGSSASVIRELLLTGIGTVAVKGSRNFGALGAATNVALGTSPATAYGRYRVAQRGTTHSYEVSSVNGGAWTLTGGDLMVRESRPPGMGL